MNPKLWVERWDLSSLVPLSNSPRVLPSEPTRGGGTARLASNNRLTVVLDKLISLYLTDMSRCGARSPWRAIRWCWRSPSALLLSHTPQKTLGGPAHLLLSHRGWCLRTSEGGENHTRNRYRCVPVKYICFSQCRWINHFCCQYRVAWMQLSRVTAQCICLEVHVPFTFALPSKTMLIYRNCDSSVLFHFKNTHILILQSVL